MTATSPAPASVEEIADLMRRLTDLYEAATAAMGQPETPTSATLTAEAAAVGRAYAARVQQLGGGFLDAAARARLAPLARRLREAADRHERQLHIAVAAQRRLLDCVRDAVSDHAAGPGIYSRRGTAGHAAICKASPPAVALSRAV